MGDSPTEKGITAEERFLLAVSSPSANGANLDAAVGRVTRWDRAFDLAGRHLLGAPLALRLQRLRLTEALPPEVRSRVERLSVESFILDQWNLKQFAQLREELDRARVPFILLKGQSLAERLYEDPAERTSRDIDILVPADRMRAAAERLEVRGFVAFRKEIFEETHFHVAFCENGGRGPTVVELHWDVTPPGSAVRLETDRWWAGARRVALRSGEVLVPPEPEEIIYLAWHAFSKGTATLRDLREVAVLWMMRGERFTRESVLARAEQGGAELFVREALFQAASLWGEAADFGGGPARRWIVRRLFETGAILRQDSRSSAELRRITYWALLPGRRAGLPRLFLDAIREESDTQRQQGAELGWVGRARVVAQTVRGLGFCAAWAGPRDEADG